MPDSKTRTPINLVVSLIEFVAVCGPTNDELAKFRAEHGKVCGLDGLFEVNNLVYQLKPAAMSILLNHRSIEQAKLHARTAQWYSFVAFLISAAALVCNIIALCWTIPTP